jgi:urea transport system permease protein
VGGRGTLVGAVLGAGLVNLAKSWFTVSFPEYWPFFLGFLFIAVTLLLPKGVVGLWAQRRSRRTGQDSVSAASAARSPETAVAGQISKSTRGATA